MEKMETERAFEEQHLEKTIFIAEGQLAQLQKRGDRQLSELVEAQKELRENSRHSIGNLWSADRFAELADLSQYVNPVSSQVSVMEAEANRMLALQRMTQNPYFARIDFQFSGEACPEKVYIGRSSLMEEETVDIYVYDWRAPIASVFYRFGAGSAFYEAPDGKVTGEVTLKRQFEIQTGQLRYFFDADLQIMDEFLRRLLSQNASPKMKTIVETIQKDQDIVIRDMENDLMMVQGAAGSGKTSVALHRAAYLMYQGLSKKLTAHNIIIVSPSTLFERYISNVLPELSEENVTTATFEEMLHTILPDVKMQTRNQLLESLMTSEEKEKRALRKSVLEFKTSSQFKEILERFVRDIPRKWIPFTDLYYDGKCIFSGHMLREEILSKRQNLALGPRLMRLSDSIFEEVHEMRKNRMRKLRDFVRRYKEHMFEVEEFARLISIGESTMLSQNVEKFTKLDIRRLYEKLFQDAAYFHRLAKGIALPPNIEQMLLFSREAQQEDQMSYEDGLALAFLGLKLNGFHAEKPIKQVIIDEVQDYYPLHFEILNILFPKARYTVFGDIQQTVEKAEDMRFFTQLQSVLNKRKSSLVALNKSFRCTSEILDFSGKFLPKGVKVESFSRSGTAPEVHGAQDREELLRLVCEEIKECSAAGYQSIGLLVKTARDAALLYENLKDQMEIRLVESDGNADIQGLLVLPIYMAKGLEFDACLLCDADEEHYACEEDQKLLYIACTRALHRLTLFYTGKKSPLL